MKRMEDDTDEANKERGKMRGFTPSSPIPHQQYPTTPHTYTLIDGGGWQENSEGEKSVTFSHECMRTGTHGTGKNLAAMDWPLEVKERERGGN